MLAKKFLAGVFAVIILLKIFILITYPHIWLGAAKALAAHQATAMIIYLILLVITGYYLFFRLDLLDLAVAMFFTSLMIGISITPYASLLPKLPEEILSLGLGQAWLPLILWGALAVVVLYKIFSPERSRWR